MARKGLSTTLVLIVTIVVLLVVALVLLTVFGGVVQNFTTLADAKAQCGLFFGAFCYKSGEQCAQAPATWGTPLLKYNDVPTSCNTICTGDAGWDGACPAPGCVFTC